MSTEFKPCPFCAGTNITQISQGMFIVGVKCQTCGTGKSSPNSWNTRERKIPVKIGDKIFIHCDSSFGSSSTGYDTVTDITTQYNEQTGIPYPVIWFGRHKFHGVTGAALNSPTAYYLMLGYTEDHPDG
jgi:hypothetical protein